LREKARDRLRFGKKLSVRLLAGELAGRFGPFSTVQPLLMADVTLPPGQAVMIPVRANFETAIAFVFRGGARVNGAAAGKNEVVLLDGSDAAGGRGLELAATGPDGARVMLFCDKRLMQPIAGTVRSCSRRRPRSAQRSRSTSAVLFRPCVRPLITNRSRRSRRTTRRAARPRCRVGRVGLVDGWLRAARVRVCVVELCSARRRFL